MFIHFHGIDMVARSLMDGTFGHHGHQEHDHEVGSHRTAHDVEHPRGEGIVVDAPGNVAALTIQPTTTKTANPRSTITSTPHCRSTRRCLEEMTPGKALLLAIPLYLWNFAPSSVPP